MADSHVISALKDKRARVAGEILASERRISELRAILVNLDGTMRLFAGEEFNPESISAKMPRTKRVPAELGGRGEMTRAVLDTLRRSEAPLTLSQLSSELAAAAGIGPEHRGVDKLISAALYRQRGNPPVFNGAYS